MGYETRIHVVSEYTFDLGDIKSGEELAVINLCKCGYDGPLAKLMEQYRQKKEKGKKPPFSLYSRNPDRQHRAVDVLRKLAENIKKKGNDKKAKYINKLSDDIEDGSITTDCYGDYLGVIPIDEFIEALEQELQIEKYRRFEWALVLLKSIRDSWEGRNDRLKVITYGY
jgi:hypothetical protein